MHMRAHTHTNFEETEQTSEPDMSEMLALSEQKFKTTLIKKLRALLNKIGSMRKDG